MSGSLAIAGVTAALRDLLNNGMVNNDLSVPPNVTVSAVPPDHIGTGSGTEKDLLNLFLYQVTPNLGWRNADLPSRDGDGARRLTNPPLALDLHYLMTAYGSKDMNAEILLGYGMQVLHENPGLSRQQLRTALQNPTTVDGTPISGVLGNLSAEDLANQVEAIKITPVFLSTEELSKLWTSMQARYRPSMAYLVSVVLIQATKPVKSAQPVLKRGPDDRGPVATGAPAPLLSSVRPAASPFLPAMRLGDDLLISGANLEASADTTAILENTDSTGTTQQQLAVTGLSPPASVGAKLPSLAADPEAMRRWRIGVWNVALEVARPNQPVFRSNAVPIALAPLIAIDPAAVKPNSVAAGSEVSLTCAPRLTPLQEKNARVIFGDQEVAPKTVATPVDDPAHPNNHLLPTTLSFVVPATDAAGGPLKAGEYLIRLRVDGIDSLPVTPPASAAATLDYDPQQKVNVA